MIAKLERETERRILLELEVKKLCARFSVALPDIVSSSPSHHNSFSHSPAYPSTPPEARSGGEKKEKGGSSGGGGKDGKRRGNRVVGRKARARVRSPTRTPPLPTTKRTRRSPPRPRPSPEGKRRRGGKERVDHSSFIFQDDAEADFVSSSSSSSSLSSSSGVLLLPSNTEPDPVVSLIHTDEDEGAGIDSFSHTIDTRDGTHEHRRGHRHPTRTPTSPSPPTPSPSPPTPTPNPRHPSPPPLSLLKGRTLEPRSTTPTAQPQPEQPRPSPMAALNDSSVLHMEMEMYRSEIQVERSLRYQLESRNAQLYARIVDLTKLLHLHNQGPTR